jgi:hypothetical protein
MYGTEKIWRPNTGIITPIDETQIPDFLQWIMYNGFRSGWDDEGLELDGVTDRLHLAYDFSAYLTTDGEIRLGLPINKPLVRAVDTGRVAQVYTNHRYPYFNEITIAHDGCEDGEISGLCGRGSYYLHVKPLVEPGDMVEKGQQIAEVCYDPNPEFPYPHIHCSLRNKNAFTTNPKNHVNPVHIIPGLRTLVAIPQMGYKRENGIAIPHFKLLEFIKKDLKNSKSN